jgi:uncharacterized membrane protein
VSPRALSLSLFASLALNLFLVGTIVGGLVIGHRVHAVMMMGHGGAHPLWTAADTLPPAHRQAYQALLRDQATTVAIQIRQARRDRREAWAGLMAQPFDAEGTGKRLADARTLEMQARGGVEQKIVEFAATLPPDERARLADGLAHSSPAPRGGMPHMRGPDGPEGPET